MKTYSQVPLDGKMSADIGKKKYRRKVEKQNEN